LATPAFQNDSLHALPPLAENIICGNSHHRTDILDSGKIRAEEKEIEPLDSRNASRNFPAQNFGRRMHERPAT